MSRPYGSDEVRELRGGSRWASLVVPGNFWSSTGTVGLLRLHEGNPPVDYAYFSLILELVYAAIIHSDHIFLEMRLSIFYVHQPD